MYASRQYNKYHMMTVNVKLLSLFLYVEKFIATDISVAVKQNMLYELRNALNTSMNQMGV